MYFRLCSCHVTYGFQSESALYNCLNVKELLARRRHKIWSLSDCNWTRTQNHLVRKRTLNHLAKLAKCLSVRLRTKWFWVRVQLQSCTLEWTWKWKNQCRCFTWIAFIELNFTVTFLLTRKTWDDRFCW